MSVDLYLIRAAETIASKCGVIIGKKDSKLTPQGEKSARELGESLCDIVFDRVYVSSLGRARDTESLMIEGGFRPNERKIASNIIERGFGILEGALPVFFELKNDEPFIYASDSYCVGMENLENVKKRIGTFIQKNIAGRDGSTIAVVGHNWANSYMMNLLLGEEIAPENFRSSSHCGVNYFRLNDEGNVVFRQIGYRPEKDRGWVDAFIKYEQKMKDEPFIFGKN